MLSHTIPPLAWAFLIGTPLMVSFGQLLFKMVGSRWSEDRTLIHVFFDPYFIAAMVLYGTGALMWIFALRTAPVGLAYTFNALGFLFVPILSMAAFGEPLGWKYFAGVALILGGLYVIHS
ncbi:MAG: transporter [Pseudomonadota bacterium]